MSCFKEGEYTCAICGRKNKEGEYFHLDTRNLLSTDMHCDDCYEQIRGEEKEKQRQKYVSGEEIPEDTDEIVCPYCGYEHKESWEYSEDWDKIECEDCGRKFEYSRNIEVTYSTSRIEGE